MHFQGRDSLMVLLENGETFQWSVPKSGKKGGKERLLLQRQLFFSNKEKIKRTPPNNSFCIRLKAVLFIFHY